VSLRVYNAGGRLVRVLTDGRAKPGTHTSVWYGMGCPRFDGHQQWLV
jgi:hypothetical protein